MSVLQEHLNQIVYNVRTVADNVLTLLINALCATEPRTVISNLPIIHALATMATSTTELTNCVLLAIIHVKLALILRNAILALVIE